MAKRKDIIIKEKTTELTKRQLEAMVIRRLYFEITMTNPLSNPKFEITAGKVVKLLSEKLYKKGSEQQYYISADEKEIFEVLSKIAMRGEFREEYFIDIDDHDENCKSAVFITLRKMLYPNDGVFQLSRRIDYSIRL